MKHYRVIIDYFGDLGSICMAIDELIAAVPVSELDCIDIEIRKEDDEEDA